MPKEPTSKRGRFDYGDEHDEGAPPSAAARPSARDVQTVDEETSLRIRPDEKTPEPGNEGAVRVPEAEWEEHNRRKDTATALATDDEPIE